MTTEDNQTTEWGAPRPKRRRSPRNVMVALVAAVAIAGGGAGVVYAATDSTDSSTGGVSAAPDGGMGGPPGGTGGVADALHGEFVISDGDGAYTTELVQTGEITAISDTSVTAESEDGYTHTYTIDTDSVLSTDSGTPAAGDEVTITATVSDDTATVESITEPRATNGPPDGVSN